MLKLALISDVHYGLGSSSKKRKTWLGRILLRKAIHRINQEIKPDLTIVLGDMLDNCNSSNAVKQLTEIAYDLNYLDSDTLALPGNHDPAPEEFYRIMPSPSEPWIDINGCRIVCYLDKEAPQWNATRSEDDLQHMDRARESFDGPIIALQHVPLSPPELEICRYNLTNANDVIDAMRRNRIQLSLGGHEHDGFDCEQDGVRYFCAGALCEAPFRYYSVEIDQDKNRIEEHCIQWPNELSLLDLHCHTEYAYCGRGVNMPLTMSIGREMGLQGVAFTEHSGQLYFHADDFWSSEFFYRGIKGATPDANRRDDYLRSIRAHRSDHIWSGMEVDCDSHGDPVLHPADREDFDLLIGSLHFMPLSNLRFQEPDKAYDLFLSLMKRFTASGIDVLAHPFRLLKVNEFPIPKKVWGPIVEMLRENNVATELNFHHCEPERDYVRACIDAGIRVTLASDAHQPYQVGELGPHLRLLKEIGCDGSLDDILYQPTHR